MYIVDNIQDLTMFQGLLDLIQYSIIYNMKFQQILNYNDNEYRLKLLRMNSLN